MRSTTKQPWRFILPALLVIFQLQVEAVVIHVHHGRKDGIRLALKLARPGDTVSVGPGVYREGNLVIDKPLVLIGTGRPVLDGDHKVEIITVTSDDVTVRGFLFKNTAIGSMEDYAAVRVLSARRVLIEDNEGLDNFFGFHFSKSADCVVRNNRLLNRKRFSPGSGDDAPTQLGNGIHLWKCSGFIIEHNRVEGHRDGIYFEFVTESVIRGNHSEGNMRYGLHFMFSNDNRYLGNRFKGNGAGVAVMYSTRVEMIGNHFERNWGPSSYGLLLKDIRDSQVRNNQFDHNTAGIYMEGSSRMRFTENEFLGNGWAVRIQANCDDNTFDNSNFISNTFDVATNGTLVLNRFEGNYWDRYQGYDLDHDGRGDTPFHPMNFYSMVVERMPPMLMLWRSFFVQLLDRAEKAIPVLTPEALRDNHPSLIPHDLAGTD